MWCGSEVAALLGFTAFCPIYVYRDGDKCGRLQCLQILRQGFCLTSDESGTQELRNSGKEDHYTRHSAPVLDTGPESDQASLG